MKSKVPVIFMALLMCSVSGVMGQNSFQKVMVADSFGFFGIKANPDTSCLIGCNTASSWQLLKMDRYGMISSIKSCPENDSVFIGMQQMLALKDGGTLFYGMYNGVGLLVRLDNNDNITWSKKVVPGFGFGSGDYFYDAVEDDSGDILLLYYLSGPAQWHLISVSTQGDYKWARESALSQGLTQIHEATNNRFYLSGSSGSASYLWEVDHGAGTISSKTLIINEQGVLIKDIAELPDQSRLLVLQINNSIRKQFVIARVNADWGTIWARKVQYYCGFREAGRILNSSVDGFSIAANIVNPEFAQESYPPFQVFSADFSIDGALLSARRYHGGYKISAISQVSMSADNSMIVAGFVADSFNFPYFPYLLKTDVQGNTSCFQDTVNLSVTPIDLTIQGIDNPLVSANDSLVNVSLSLTEVVPRQLTQLCFQGIGTHDQAEGTLVYPNPGSEFISISIGNHRGKLLNVELLNMNGQLIKSKLVERVTDNIEMYVKDISPGCYIIRASSSMGTFYQKFIRE